jgi:hypothetical protein
MSLLSIVGDIAGNVLSGGVTSLIGVGMKSFFDYKNKKLDFEQAIALKKADAEIMALEWQGRDKVAATETAGAVAVAEQASFQASYRSEEKNLLGGMKRPEGWIGRQVFYPLIYFLLGLTEVIKGIIRPGMALYLTGFATTMAVAVHQAMQTAVTDAQVYELARQIVNTGLYLWTTCVLWYYGVRNNQAQK